MAVIKGRSFISSGNYIYVIPNNTRKIVRIDRALKIEIIEDKLNEISLGDYLSIKNDETIFFICTVTGEVHHFSLDEQKVVYSSYGEKPFSLCNCFLRENTIILFPKNLNNDCIIYDIHTGERCIENRWNKVRELSLQNREVRNVCMHGNILYFTLKGNKKVYRYDFSCIEEIDINACDELKSICSFNDLVYIGCMQKEYLYQYDYKNNAVVKIKLFHNIKMISVLNNKLLVQTTDEVYLMDVKKQTYEKITMEKILQNMENITLFFNIIDMDGATYFMPYGANVVGVLSSNEMEFYKLEKTRLYDDNMRTFEGNMSLSEFISSI